MSEQQQPQQEGSDKLPIYSLLALIAGLIVFGVFAGPGLMDWFNDNFGPEEEEGIDWEANEPERTDQDYTELLGTIRGVQAEIDNLRERIEWLENKRAVDPLLAPFAEEDYEYMRKARDAYSEMLLAYTIYVELEEQAHVHRGSARDTDHFFDGEFLSLMATAAGHCGQGVIKAQEIWPWSRYQGLYNLHARLLMSGLYCDRVGDYFSHDMDSDIFRGVTADQMDWLLIELDTNLSWVLQDISQYSDAAGQIIESEDQVGH